MKEKQILDHLQGGQEISEIGAQNLYDCNLLHSTIDELRAKGHKITNRHEGNQIFYSL